MDLLNRFWYKNPKHFHGCDFFILAALTRQTFLQLNFHKWSRWPKTKVLLCKHRSYLNITASTTIFFFWHDPFNFYTGVSIFWQIYLTALGLRTGYSCWSVFSTCRASSSKRVMTSPLWVCSEEEHTGDFTSCSKTRYLLSTWHSLASKLLYCTAPKKGEKSARNMRKWFLRKQSLHRQLMDNKKWNARNKREI